MAVTSTGLASTKRRRASHGRPDSAPATSPAVPFICPYLVASDGSWRSARPSRDHRCGALDPPAPLALDKQRRLCVTRGHTSCATRAAAHARAAGEDPGDAVAAAGQAAPAAQGATRWSIVRTAPLVLDSTSSSRSPAGRRQLVHRSIGAVLAVGLAALALARLVEPAASSVPPGVLAATGAPSAAALVAAATPTRAAPDRSSSAPTSSPPSAAPPRSAAPSRPLASRGPGAYVVRPGDTLYSIARAYHTTVAQLQELNDLAGSTVIRAGQELVLP